jgi:hypothetical protein
MRHAIIRIAIASADTLLPYRTCRAALSLTPRRHAAPPPRRAAPRHAALRRMRGMDVGSSVGREDDLCAMLGAATGLTPARANRPIERRAARSRLKISVTSKTPYQLAWPLLLFVDEAAPFLVKR